MFSNFRREDFKQNLMQKAKTTLRLLRQVKEIDYQILKVIDINTINELNNEKILIFDDSLKLIYSSLDDAVINWDDQLLKTIQKENMIYRSNKDFDILGIKGDLNNRSYIVLVAGEDTYGNNKLNFLRYLALFTFIGGLILVWLLSQYFSKRALLPLDQFKKNVQNITETNLSTRLKTTNQKDEISELTTAFNFMLDRIDRSFQYQKSFVGSASHELRTPLSKISTQLENLLQNPDLPDNLSNILSSIKEDTQQLSDIVTSLLILSKIENEKQQKNLPFIRIDEIIFSSFEFLKRFYPEFKIFFEINNKTSKDDKLEIKGDEALLKLLFNNLLKNAYLYSDNKTANIRILQFDNYLEIIISNLGKTPELKDTQDLFSSFTRGSNALQNRGFGLGLSIVKRIIQYHNAEIIYNIPQENLNELIIRFKF